jgi:hypothetical protein
MKRLITSCAFAVMALLCHGQSAVIDSLLSELSKHTRDTNEIRTLDRLGNEFMRRDMARAKAYSWQQIALAKTLGTNFGVPAAYAGLVAMYQNEGRMDSAPITTAPDSSTKTKANTKKPFPFSKEL